VGRRVRRIHQGSDGRIWVATGRGVRIYDPRAAGRSAWSALTVADGLPDDDIRDILEDRSGKTWIATARGVAVYDGRSVRSPGEALSFTDDPVRSIAEDRNGVLWFIVEDDIFRYDGRTVTRFTEIEGLRDLRPSRLFADTEGVLWISTSQGGVLRYDGQRVASFTQNEGLGALTAQWVSEDHEGNIWVGTYGGGISRTAMRSMYTWASDEVFSVVERSNGDVVLGIANGIFHFDEGDLSPLFETDVMPENIGRNLVEDRDGTVWFTNRWFGGDLWRITDGAPTEVFGNEGEQIRVRDVIQSDGKLWFLHSRSGGVSRYDGKRFETFTESDGLLSNDAKDACTDAEGNLWFLHDRGLTRLTLPLVGKPGRREGAFTPFPERLNRPVRILCNRFGVIWVGGARGLSRFDPGSGTWTHSTDIEEWAVGYVFSLGEDREGNLLIGTNGAGLKRYDGHVFQTIEKRDGLPSNAVFKTTLGRDGSIWVGTTTGVARYRPTRTKPSIFFDEVVADRRYRPEEDIRFSSSQRLVEISFYGRSMKTRPEAMVYRYRMTGLDTAWVTTNKPRAEFENLPSGDFSFEVQAVDRDLGYSDVATLKLSVHPPYGQMAMAGGLLVAFSLVGWQTVRVVRRDRRLKQSNEALSSANNELFQVNQALQRDRSVERIRGQVQSMGRAEDFEKVLSMLMSDLKEVGLTFGSCEIDVLDEPVENPSMKLFEEKGFHYSTYTLDPEGHVASRSYRVAAPFPSVIEQTIERFIAGEPWQAVIEGSEAILEVPAGSYGRLRLTASDREQFTEDEVTTLREFASAVALGYARYLDIREIQEATVKKSAFLASMSHELRTPMNAIKGFTDLVLGRRSENLNDQQRENLGKVSQASDHLLAMINDLLDLSKIEAGRMDVNPERFNVKALVASCCDTVSPLIQEGVELKQEVAEVEANTDKARVQQMVINLLSNAIKFTDEGAVTVKAFTSERESRSVSPAGRGESGRNILVISVNDTGKGIPAEELPTLFDEYRQVKGESESSVQKGTGLGLSITKKFAELLGGSIGVESEVGKGTTFTILIPATYEEEK